MSQTLYVIQPFSRDDTGVLVWDAPTWSKDRSFAATLTHSLSKRKAGVIAVGITVDRSGTPGPEAEVIESYGAVPTSLVLGSLNDHPTKIPSPARAADLRRRA